MEKGQSFHRMSRGRLDIYIKRKKNLDTDLTCITKISLRWIIDLKIKHKFYKLLEESGGKNSGDFGFDNAFLGIKPKHHP